MKALHPDQALFPGEKPFPVLPGCEHFAGSEKLIGKAFSFQEEKGPVFDITQDCEDGAPEGQEKEHAEMIVRMTNSKQNIFKMAGARVHDYTSPFWKQDVEILVKGAGEHLAYLTIPKPTSADQVDEMISFIQDTAVKCGLRREIPVHVLIETHGALYDARKIAALPWMQVLDFGLMDFVSGHHGAIALSNMKSPGQFEHELLRRAKTEVVAAALSSGVVPAHNVTLDLKNYDQTLSDALRAKNEFGFLRMWSIYPVQIDAIVDAMKPDLSDVEKGISILMKAQEADWGPIQHDGELHDRATFRGFWNLVKRAKVSGVSLSEEALQRWF
ncbi:MAG: aldolase/citrate lyase family protein [Spirochaetia bacterium]|nr:aldolase/citrate lyase family protein [Spirochaetia bacterium]